MARVAGGRGAGKRRSLPSAQELMNDLGRSVFGSEFTGAPVTASTAEFRNLRNRMEDESQSLDFFLFDDERVDYENRAGQNTANSYRRQFEDVTGNTPIIPGYAGPQNEEDTSPAPISVVPTSTTNPERPRTVAAGYDADEEKLTVVFRDGTFYNYYEVDENEWAAFKANRSKGAIIYRMLDFKPRGPADESSISQSAREAYYRFARGAQLHSSGKAKGQNKTTYKTKAQATKKRK
jgi:KTSC domain